MTDSLHAAIRRAIELAPCSARQLALEADIDPSLLARMASGDRTVTAATAAKLEHALRRWAERSIEAAEGIRRANNPRR